MTTFDPEFLDQFLDVFRIASFVQRVAMLEAAISETDGMTFLYDLASEAGSDFPLVVQVLIAIRLSINGIPDSFPADQVIHSEVVNHIEVGLMRAVIVGVDRGADNSATHRVVNLYTVDPLTFDAEDEYPGFLVLVADGLRMPVVRSASASARAPTGMASRAPTGAPTGMPAGVPAGAPTGMPAGVPAGAPTRAPTGMPAGVLARALAGVPVRTSSCALTYTPTRTPTGPSASSHVRTPAPSLDPQARMPSHASAVGTRR